MAKQILIIGACGQIGTELTVALRQKYGNQNVVASDIRESGNDFIKEGPFELLDAQNTEAVEKIVEKYNIEEVYLMAAMLSATAEKKPMQGWNLNMNSFFNVLDLAKDKKIKKVFWPSSIAVFGHSTPKDDVPQSTVTEPDTVYGISKLAGERWCEYYGRKYGVDVRSMRYPGLISYKSPPGGGTTDYAVEIYYEALEKGKYTSFIDEDTPLPMMYMEDAVRAMLMLMEAPRENITVYSSYNVGSMSFTPKTITESIKQELPEFTIDYAPDFRDKIAESWPSSIDDSQARNDWNWKPEYDLKRMTKVMLENIAEKVA